MRWGTPSAAPSPRATTPCRRSPSCPAGRPRASPGSRRGKTPPWSPSSRSSRASWGRSAEVVVFGEDEVTTGASGDLQQVSNMAKQMVTNYGMSEIGPWSLQDEGAQSQDMIMRMMSRNNTSEKLLEQIDDAVKKVSDEAYATALKQISDNREAMDKVVEILCEKETMSGDEFRAILAEYTVIPEENLEAARATVTIN